MPGQRRLGIARPRPGRPGWLLAGAVVLFEFSTGLPRLDTSADAIPGAAADNWLLVPEVGPSGNAVPLQTFEEQLSGIGSDGSRAHALQVPCSP